MKSTMLRDLFHCLKHIFRCKFNTPCLSMEQLFQLQFNYNPLTEITKSLRTILLNLLVGLVASNPRHKTIIQKLNIFPMLRLWWALQLLQILDGDLQVFQIANNYSENIIDQLAVTSDAISK